MNKIKTLFDEGLEWLKEHWFRVIVVVIAVTTISLGALKLEANQAAVKQEQFLSCQRANDTNDGIRNILTYLDQRRSQGTTGPVTPEQAAIEAHVRHLIPRHQDC